MRPMEQTRSYRLAINRNITHYHPMDITLYFNAVGSLIGAERIHTIARYAPAGSGKTRRARSWHRALRTGSALALAALLAACATAPRVPRNDAAQGRAIAAVAVGLLGTPYRFGGSDDRGFDCSGLAVYAYENVGIAIPRTAAEQERSARPVALPDLLPGDLLFFRIGAHHVDHVGIYVGGGRFIHAPRSGALVSYGSLVRGFYRRHLLSAGRFWR
jgi:cell wall-associated NlpC family hydrolase